MAAIAVATAGSGLLGFMMLPSFADSDDHAMRGDQDLRISVQDDEAPTVSKSRFLFGGRFSLLFSINFFPYANIVCYFNNKLCTSVK